MPLSPFRLLGIFGYGAAAVAVAAIILLAAAVVFRFDCSWPSSLLFVVTFFDFAFGFAFARGWV
jgi:hypothetical protein